MFQALPELRVEPLHRLSHRLQSLIASHLWAKVLLGMLLGTGTGVLLGPEVGWVEPRRAEAIVSWLALPGHLFLALVQMIVVALIASSIIRGLGASDDVEQLKALGLRAIVYFVGTSALAISLGIGVAYLISPGRFLPASALATGGPGGAGVDAAALGEGSIPERIVGLLPSNPLASMAEGEMLQIVIFSIVIGVAMVSMPVERSRPLFDLLGAIQEVCMRVVEGAMRLAPAAVFGLMSRATATMGLETLAGLGVYAATVLLGLVALVVMYLVMVALFTRTSPLAFLSAAREVQLLAFSTSSSAAVMPLSLKVAEEKLGVRSQNARFIIPLGATINMDGTALYQGVATVFLAQAFGIELGAVSLGFVVVTAVAASIGAPATPGVGIVVLASVLESVGIPPTGVALILGVDRLLDMSRTAVNVTGDLCAALVLDRWLPADATAADVGAPAAETSG